ncbi:MAG: hypothetical protein ACI97K_000852 [Glaciecola sp.]
MKKNLRKWFGVVDPSTHSLKNVKHAIFILASFLLPAQNCIAQDELLTERDSLMQYSEQKSVEKTPVSPPIVQLGDEFQNSILLLNNRFRVDNDVDQVTMVFFRDEGSAPIVLVRPDGSKVFIEDDEQNPDLLWYETQTYDMISITKPMPGPWQAVGAILDGSKVMVIADIVLDAEPIPQNIYSGEIIKHTAVLQNDGKQVDFSPFRDVVSISIDFVSNNNPNYENFGLGSRTIARFQDNGQGLDEVAADGVFTGQFNLSIPSGEWRPTFSIRTPMYNREQINKTVILHSNPILIGVEIDESEQGKHIVTVDTDSKHIKLSSLLLDGRITRPNSEEDKITLTETSDLVKMIEVKNDSFGIYRVKLTAFATTVDGREVIINVPEYTFVTSAPPEPEPIQEEIVPIAPESNLKIVPIDKDLKDSLSAADTISIAITINLVILIFGGTGIFLILNKRKYPDDHLMLRFKNACSGVLDKLKSLKNKTVNEDVPDAESKLK